MRAAARYLKGCEMLEPYAVKVARTVLRRGGASNRFLLSLHHRNLAAGGAACVTLKVVAYAGIGGTTLGNCTIIDSDETDPTEACAETVVCARELRPPMPVPTLTPPGMALMIGLLAVVGSVMLRRRE